MPLTPEEQRELDELELEKLQSEKNAAVKTEVKAAESTVPAADGEPEIPVFINGMNFTVKAKTAGHVLEKLAGMGIRAAGPAAGQAIGALAGPFAEVGIPVGGAIGGMISEGIANSREGVPNTAGKYFGAAISGAIPGATAAKAGLSVARQNAGRYAAGGMVASAAESLKDRGTIDPADMVMRGAGGIVGARVQERFGGPNKVVTAAAAKTDEQANNAMRLEAFQALQPDGVKVPPSELGQGSDVVASIGGKAATQQQAAIQNQTVWQKLAKRTLDLPESAGPIRDPALKGPAAVKKAFTNYREKNFEPYQTIQSVQEKAATDLRALKQQFSEPQELAAALASPEGQRLQIQAAADVDALKVIRKNAQEAYEKFANNNDPAAYDTWKALQSAGEAMEGAIDKAAATIDDPQLGQRLVDARRNIAKSYALQNATNSSTGLVNPISLGVQLENDVPLTDDLLKIANFARSFNKEAVEASRVPNPNVGNVGFMAAGNELAHGNASGVMTAISQMFGPKQARKFLLSDTQQSKLAGNPVEQKTFQQAYLRYLTENHPLRRRRAEEDESAKP